MTRTILAKYKERRNGPNYKVPRDDLDDLLSLNRKENEPKGMKNSSDSEMSDVEKSVSKNVYDYSSDSSGQGTHY